VVDLPVEEGVAAATVEEMRGGDGRWLGLGAVALEEERRGARDRSRGGVGHGPELRSPRDLIIFSGSGTLCV